MLVEMQYSGRSAIVNGMRDARMVFAADRTREPVFFHGNLADPILFREALAALYHVVVSDYKYRPKDRLAFKAWLEQQDQKFLASLGVRNKRALARMEEIESRMTELNRARDERRRSFHRARESFFDFIYKNEYELEYLLDPVVAIHPDEISFEAFSRDESTYARLAAKYELFNKVDEFECGVTNIDFSANLHGEMERLRAYRQTRLDVAASGLTLTTGGDAIKEKKIDLPESWIKGFLQVHSTMTLGLTRFHMAPVDLYNICRYLRRHKTKKSPRALRYELVPGQPARAILEPWEHVIELSAASTVAGDRPLSLQNTPGAICDANKPASIRTWGRDRLQVLARLLPICRRIDVFLAGHGLPSIYVLDLGPLTFTLALSGWTDNDWTGGEAKFDLLSRQLKVDSSAVTKTYDALAAEYVATEGSLANDTGLGIETTRSALSHLCQTGRAMYDLAGSVYRRRELFAKPLKFEEVLKATKASSPEEQNAKTIFDRNDVRITSRRPVATGYKLTGSAKGSDAARVRPLLHVDHDGRIIEGECTCAYFKNHKMTKGPCEHVLALRLAHMEKLE